MFDRAKGALDPPWWTTYIRHACAAAIQATRGGHGRREPRNSGALGRVWTIFPDGAELMSTDTLYRTLQQARSSLPSWGRSQGSRNTARSRSALIRPLETSTPQKRAVRGTLSCNQTYYT